MKDYRNLVSIEDFRDPSRFIYNSDLVTFTEFGAQLKDLVPANICMGATFKNSSSGSYGNGTIDLFGNVYGQVTVQNGRLALLGGHTEKSIDYFIANDKSLAEAIPTGRVTFQFYPNYSGLPKSTQNIFYFGSHEFHATSHMHILHTTTGDIIFRVFDKSGIDYTVKRDSVVVKTAMEPLEFRVIWNSIDAQENDLQQDEARVKLYFYFEGIQVGSLDFDAHVFSLDQIYKFGFGQNLPLKQYSNFCIDNLVVESLDPANLVIPESYEPHAYLIPDSRYTTTPQRIEPKQAISLEKLKSVVPSVLEDTSGLKDFYVGYTFFIDGYEYYFDRSDMFWKQHTEPDQISDLPFMLLNSQALITKGCEFKLIPYLRSIKGESTPQITSLTTTYDEFIPCPIEHPQALVYGYVRDVLGNVVHGAKVCITPSRSSVSTVGNFILPKMTKIVRTGQNGYWDAPLPLSCSFPEPITYNFQIVIRDEIVYKVANVKILQEGSIKFEDLIAQQEFTPGTKPLPPCCPFPPIPGELPEEIKDEIDKEVEEQVEEKMGPEIAEALVQMQTLRYKESLDDE